MIAPHRIPPAAIHVIPLVAIGSITPREDASEDTRMVLFFGRIWPYKGLDYLIRAEPLVTACVPDARFVIAAGRGVSRPVEN